MQASPLRGSTRRRELSKLSYLFVPERRFSTAAAVAFCAAVGSALVAAADAEERELLLVRAPGVPLDAAIALVLEPADGETATHHLAATGRRRVTLPAGFVGRIGCRGDGFWCPSQTAGADVAAVSIPVFRTGRIRGHVVPTREGAPDRVLVEGTVALSGSLDVRFEHEVDVGEAGELVFEAPQGELDLRFAAEGRAPVYLWGLEVDDEAAQLGPLRFARGSSVSGFVHHAATELPVSGASVAALPASADDFGEDARRRLEALAIGSKTNERGFFQLIGLPPGRYRLAVAFEGLFPTGPPLVEVVEDSESHLGQSIALQPAVRLTLFVDPPRPPGEAGWRVEVVQQTGPEILQAATDEQGKAEVERLVPGPYRIEVGSRRHPTVWQRHVQLSSDLVLTADLPLVELVGSVRLGEEPVVAEISIQTGARDHWRYRSDEEGRFGGILRVPELDILFVEIESEEPTLSKRLQIRGLDAEDGVVELDLALDDRTIDGTVVDGLGNPVAGAEVTVHADEERVAEATTAEDGTFAIRALDRDLYRVHAWRRGRGTSEAVEADLSSSEHAGPYRLTLVEVRRVDGTLRTADGRPIQGARIEAHTWLPVPYAEVGRTDLAGRFWIDVPRDSRRAHLEIAAPSLGLIAVCADLPAPDDLLDLALPGTADATVDVDLEASPDLPPAIVHPLVLLRRGGGYLSLSTLGGWSGESWRRRDDGAPYGAAMVAGGLFPGEYALAWLDGPYWYQAAAACEPALRPEPAWRSVGPGGTLRLSYDVTPRQRAASEASPVR